jgi:hypothetical protein
MVIAMATGYSGKNNEKGEGEESFVVFKYSILKSRRR